VESRVVEAGAVAGPERPVAPRMGSEHGSPLDWCWLVVAGERRGPMPFERAVEGLQALHRDGVQLYELVIVGARQPDARAKRTPGRAGSSLPPHGDLGAKLSAPGR
jgi:hypothetical protein